MAMIRCFECKKEISNQAKECPHCGYVTSRSYRKRVSERVFPVTLLTIFVCFIWLFALFTWSAIAFWVGFVILTIGGFYIEYWIRRDLRGGKEE